ncbi:Phage conserved hypothetical protein, C-terminal [uncultured Caudovirales phage]|uniref:Phage conserved hypothetical protein C-terminal domain-containing protein n=1 Tax=uncultured Caudovirales phage TaxID=2100421 RepID=A0A6J5S7B6_9CAUD|nr:Phage conserved hypothetical protein, C-terminal [uncultured Caudovirales phage]CAB4186321.1 Phage conserved hypothetical protein, C-terminal [uncultured Caudovirales phage]CAB4204456.1 Phage conserved hypothetical protein, C-terminal [uncultured Caudovirales phage]
MTKEEAWDEWLQKDGPPVVTRTEMDAFEFGWAKAIESLAKEEKEKVPFDLIIARMNNILGKSFKPTLAHKSFIRARWKEGMREEDFERVVRTKKEQWINDPKLSIYLRPETLFGTKMDAYNNEPEPKRKKIITNHMGIEVEVDE